MEAVVNCTAVQWPARGSNENETLAGSQPFIRLPLPVGSQSGHHAWREVNRSSAPIRLRFDQGDAPKSLEPYLLYEAIRPGCKVREVPVTKFYPPDRRVGYTKMKAWRDWWRISRPMLLLTLRLRC